MKRLITTTLLCLLFFSPCFAHNPLPDELVKIAKNIGCIPFTPGFHIRRLPQLFTGSSFTYLNENKDAIFFCTDKKNKRKIYLVIVENGKVILKKNWGSGSTKYTITKIEPYFYIQAINLTNFFILYPPQKKKWTQGPNVKYIPTALIDEDGTYSILIKYKNKWYYRSYD